MLSDTIHDYIKFDEIKRDIAHYKKHSDTYEYPEPLLDEILNHLDRIYEIQLKLDIGEY